MTRQESWATCCALCALLAAAETSAQEMEPRAYSASPVGLNFFGVGYNWLTGDVVSDPALLLSDVQADVRSLSVGVGHTFNLLGDLGLVTATAPYSRAVVTGKVFEQQAEARRTGAASGSPSMGHGTGVEKRGLMRAMRQPGSTTPGEALPCRYRSHARRSRWRTPQA